MSALPDLFPGFAARRLDVGAATIFARVGGEGPPVLLVHGYPQTHVEWHRIASELARRFTIVAMDSRGYGESSIPASVKGEGYSKRAIGADLIAAMAQLGHRRFAVIGHDRGGRVAYRLALDHPDHVTKLAALDIIPTIDMWEGMNATRAMQTYHWSFLAQSEPLPEMLIGKEPVRYIDHTLASWTKSKSLAPFDEGALAHYRAFFAQPERIRACCEDYRAGATIDVEHDRADRAAGKTVQCAMLALWGDAGIPAAGASPLDIWRKSFAPQATGEGIDSGHFLPEENPRATLAALVPFLAA